MYLCVVLFYKEGNSGDGCLTMSILFKCERSSELGHGTTGFSA